MPVYLTAMLIIASCIAFIMLGLSLIVTQGQRDLRSRAMVQYWLAYCLYFGLSFLTQEYVTSIGEWVIALPASLAWPWRIGAIRMLLEGIYRRSFMSRWHIPMLLSGYLLMVVIYFLGGNFTLYTIPLTVAMVSVGMHLLYKAVRGLRGQNFPALHLALLLTIGLIFIHMLNFPWLRLNPNTAFFGFGVSLFTTLMMAAIIPSVFMYELSRDRADELKRLVDERTEQLLGQSKLSALGIMAAGIAHEVNNPLSIISGRIQLLLRKRRDGRVNVDEETRELELMEQTARRISKVVTGLSDFSRDSQSDGWTMVSLPNVIDETLGFCRERFKSHQIDLTVEDCPRVKVRAHGTQLSQVFLNLLNNAFDAVSSESERWVKIQFKKLNEKLTIRILDSGPGVPVMFQDKIMEPFFTTKEVGKGTGLGLSISKGIVENHQGKFYLDRTSPATCFVIELPLGEL